jgi:chitin synthase
MPTTDRIRRPSNNQELHNIPRTRRAASGSRQPFSEKNNAASQVRMVQPSHGNMPAMPSDRDPMMDTGDLSRKKSMIRPERRRNDPDDPNYYYRKHAQNMNVMPSTTGVDPQLEDDLTTVTSTSGLARHDEMDAIPLQEKPEGSSSKRVASKLHRHASKREREKVEKDIQRQKMQEEAGALTPWGAYCHVVTFWAPNFMLSCFGKKLKEQQRAWREKVGLVSLILLVMAFVGFLTFGFTEAVCPQGGPLRLRINKVGPGYMIFHGKAYDLTRSQHPLARGVPGGSNVLFDADPPGRGRDGSFMFQNVNGHCKGLITAAAGSDVPTDNDGNLAWYFPCNPFNQDGSSQPNLTIPFYLGYACHTVRPARSAFYGLRSSGDVYFTWDDVRNTSRNLMVYSGDVLDLDLLRWFNTSQVAYPDKFDQIRTNEAIRGKDVTQAFGSGENKQIAQCFQDIIKVGSIDTETIGCIASKVVLYVSLIFILSIVVIKFVLALAFQWVLCRKYSPKKTSMTSDKKKRAQQIEEWTDDIYRAPPKITDPAAHNIGDRPANKRGSFLPTTSRFTSPYAVERSMNKKSAVPTTMISQQSSSRLMSSSYGPMNRSDTALDSDSRASLMESHQFGSQRYSSVMNTETDMSGPQGFIHESVVPQPPPEWQPFGFPLAHTICLVTAYSEGPEGIRSTLDSVAMTDYPNSHKILYIVCDGLIQGKGESMSTPDACLSMMKDHSVLPNEVEAYSYVAVASGSKRHNMAKVYCGFYDYGADSIIPVERQQRVPMVVVVKCGTPEEAGTSKPGNRGKRDSQIILMSFLQKVMFDERMTELEYEMFNGIWKLTGISPDFYEIVLMVDADTKVFPDSLTHMVSAMVKDPEIMGLCGETKIANKTSSWVSMIQVFEYFISHHQAKAFESVFGGVTCLPGCFCMYRIKTPKGGQNYWVPILANPDIVEHYSENIVNTLHKKNLLLLGEDRYLSSLMLKTFPKRKQMFIPQAVCKTTVPDTFKVLVSQRRRWINSTVHNLMELVLVRDLCGTFCFSMQFVLFIELIGTLVLPAAIAFTIYVRKYNVETHLLCHSSS